MFPEQSRAQVEWDGKFPTKSVAATPLDENGMPIMSLGVNSAVELRQQTKQRQASKTWQRSLLVTAALVPVALGGISGALFFINPVPDLYTCLKAALMAVIATLMLGGVLFSGAMFFLIRMRTGNFLMLLAVLVFGLVAAGLIPIWIWLKEDKESGDPILPAAVLAMVGTVLFTPVVAVFSRVIGGAEVAGQTIGLGPFLGGLIGAPIGVVLALVVYRFTRVSANAG
jgi:cation transport ATPase